jgi:hypothetical protein
LEEPQLVHITCPDTSKMIAKRKNTFFIVFLFYLLDNVG